MASFNSKISMQRRALFSGLMRLRMSQNDRPEAPSPATAANGSAAVKEENPAAWALVSSSKAEAESEQGAQSGGVRRLAIDVLPSGFHRAGEVPSTEHAQCATNTSALGSNQLLPRIYIAFVLLVGILLFSSLFVNVSLIWSCLEAPSFTALVAGLPLVPAVCHINGRFGTLTTVPIHHMIFSCFYRDFLLVMVLEIAGGVMD
ncbi:uncharacterized protein [Arachis hypogaea]|uniref:uncharacterized protein isoform X5 n=1 Tax=Arachis hypogaea TaxID=3818 RepID=UPI000DECC9C8|nr:uncharacterized protein LOC112762472 isoform X3 [Arachis hypogaea]